MMQDIFVVVICGDEKLGACQMTITGKEEDVKTISQRLVTLFILLNVSKCDLIPSLSFFLQAYPGPGWQRRRQRLQGERQDQQSQEAA